MLQASLAVGLTFSSHPGPDRPSVNLQSTARCLVPAPQETEHSPHMLVFHSGHSLSSHRSVVGGFVLASQLISLSLHSSERVLIPEPQVTEHLPQSPVIQYGHGLMLQSSLTGGLIFSSHPELVCPFSDLQPTVRCLWPLPQETEHSSHRLAIHSGHASRSHRRVVGGFVQESQFMSLSLHSTERILIPEPQVTEHLPQSPFIQ